MQHVLNETSLLNTSLNLVMEILFLILIFAMVITKQDVQHKHFYYHKSIQTTIIQNPNSVRRIKDHQLIVTPQSMYVP